MQLEIPDEELAPFLACLGIGTLQAIRMGAVGPEMGIWTLATPEMMRGLHRNAATPPEVLDVYSRGDELSLSRQLTADSPEVFDRQLGTLIDKLAAVLRRSSHLSWNITWLPESEYSSWDLAELLNRPRPLWLVGARLSGVELSGANLRAANLREADLSGALLRNADLSRADLTGADLSGADLTDANLTGALLLTARLREAHLYRASLQDSNLRAADLEGAILLEADLTNAYLRGANLRGAMLSGASLEGADLRDADLRDVSDLDLREAKLEDADLSGALLSDETQPPHPA